VEEKKLAGVAIWSVANCLAEEGNIANTPTSLEELWRPTEKVGSGGLPAKYASESDAAMLHCCYVDLVRSGNKLSFQ
jgi:hypothetical protein